MAPQFISETLRTRKQTWRMQRIFMTKLTVAVRKILRTRLKLQPDICTFNCYCLSYRLGLLCTGVIQSCHSACNWSHISDQQHFDLSSSVFTSPVLLTVTAVEWVKHFISCVCRIARGKYNKSWGKILRYLQAWNEMAMLGTMRATWFWLIVSNV